ncbi:MAG: protein kinase, partial [Acidobacteriaceae bacterium]|nr:protein kinase [Acidobacteriaceae bacterium]
PEQIQGGELVARSDIYSLGVTFYELVTGNRPFDGESEYQIMAAHLRGEPRAPRELDTSLPQVVNDVILTALARDPAQRFASAKAMHTALASLAPEPASLVAPRRPKAAKTHHVMYMAAGSLATIAVLIGAAVEAPKWSRAEANGSPVASHVANDSNEAPQLPAAAQAPAPVNAKPPSAPVPDTIPALKQFEENRSDDRRSRRPHNPRREHTDGVGQSTPPTDASPSEAAQQRPETAVPQSPDPEIPRLRDRLTLMNARMIAVGNSLENLRRAQAMSGLGLRSDMAAAEQRMLNEMAEAQKSLDSNDASSARMRLDAVEAQLSKLEDFLGK